MRIRKLNAKLQETFSVGVAALEQLATYPLGADSFKIDHGSDYFAFFRRLGSLVYYVALEKDEVVGVGAGVLRLIPRNDGSTVRAWYLCDLKVRPDHRGRHIPLKILSQAFPLNYLRCRRGYAISMNPPQHQNRVVPLLQRFPWARVSFAGNLLFFSMSAEQIQQSRPTIEQHRGPISFLSLDRCKQLIMQSNHQPLPLLHIQHGVNAETGFAEPQDGFIHMICAHENDPLVADMKNLGIDPSASASIIHHGLDDQPWNFILTSDI